jgi:hypothetical protein
MAPHTGGRGKKYYKPFVQAVAPKIIDALKPANAQGLPPEIRIPHTEIDEVRQRLGIDSFGSPQDVLYSFSSERYPHWGPTLDEMCFRSACMDGVGSISVTMAERYLRPGQPDCVIQELRGAIGKEFWTTSRVMFSDFPLRQNLTILADLYGTRPTLDSIINQGPVVAAAEALKAYLEALLNNSHLTAVHRKLVEISQAEIRGLLPQGQQRFNARAFAALLSGVRQHGEQMPQEQVALKYASEGQFLQKLLDGATLEHFQSNVKMISNPLRKAKCEIDSIYTVSGEKRLVLVEAKGKDRVSRTQLYQAYETFRLKLPANWELNVVAIMMTPPNADDQLAGIEAIIDLIDVGFDDTVFGKITESLTAIRSKRHIRWKIVGRD